MQTVHSLVTQKKVGLIKQFFVARYNLTCIVTAE